MSLPKNEFAEFTGRVAALCHGAESVALAGVSRRWEAALGRGRGELWRRYLAHPAYFVCPILADDMVRELLLSAVHSWNFRPVVRSLQGPGWSTRFLAVRRKAELGRLGVAAVAKVECSHPGEGGPASQPSARSGAPALAARPAKRRHASLVGAAVRELKRRRMSIAARRDTAALAEPSGEPALRAGLEVLEAASKRLEDCAQDIVGEVILGILLPIRRETLPDDPPVEAARWQLRHAVEALGRLRPPADALRSVRAVRLLGSLGHSRALARLDVAGGVRRACEQLLERWEAVLAEDVLQRQWAQFAASRARRPVACIARLSRPGPRPQRRRSLPFGARPLRRP